MNKFLAPVAAALLACSALPSSAEVLDIATLKCSDIADSSPEELGMVLAWIDGYLGGRADDTRLDLDRFGENADEAAKACEKDPNAGLLTVIKAAEAE